MYHRPTFSSQKDWNHLGFGGSDFSLSVYSLPEYYLYHSARIHEFIII